MRIFSPSGGSQICVKFSVFGHCFISHQKTYGDFVALPAVLQMSVEEGFTDLVS